MEINLKVGAMIDIEKLWSTKITDIFPPEIISSLLVILVLIIFSIVVGIVFKKALKDPLKRQGNFVTLITLGVEKVENFIVDIMGEKNRKFSGYAIVLFLYIFISFIFGLTGLASPVTYFGVPLSLGLITLVMIHVQAIKSKHWHYFHRYIEPVFFFLPINFVTMWVPMVSLSLRLFGNAIAGFSVLTICYYGLESLSSAIFGAIGSGASMIFIAPFITPALHLFFDIFDGGIQTIVFIMLTMINIYQEQDVEEEPKRVKNVQYQSK